MNLKDFDYKQFMLQKGERVGLGVALALMLLLVALGARQGLKEGSPAAKEQALVTKSAEVEQRLVTSVPGPNDLPPADADKELIAYNPDPVDPSRYPLAKLIPPPVGVGGTGRRMPLVQKIDEVRAAVDRVQVHSYLIVAGDPPRIATLVAADGKDKPDGGARGRLGRMGRGGRRPGIGGPGMGVPDYKQEESDLRQKQIPLTELDKNPGVKLARQVRPLRMVVLAGSFPYKQQLEEFRSQLGLKSVADVLNETTTETQEDPVTKEKVQEQVGTFRFLGVDVERRELDRAGRPVAGPPGQFNRLDLKKDYARYLYLGGQSYEPADPKYEPITFRGLTMPRLLHFREKEEPAAGRGSREGVLLPGGKPDMGKVEVADGESRVLYTKVEDQVQNLQKTLAELKGKGSAEVAAPPSRFSRGGVDVFDPKPDAGGSGEGTGTGGGARIDRAGKPAEAGTEDGQVPEHCLVRVIDVSVKPGHTYEYRLRARMANPNYRRPDVASRDYEKLPELEGGPWSDPVRAEVEPELRYYAVDEMELERSADPPRKYTPLHVNRPANKEKQVVLQAHRWLDEVSNGDTKLPVGEWSVAERFGVYRGEYVGQKVEVPVPYWRYTREAFVLAGKAPKGARKAGTPNNPTIEVDFGYDWPNDPPEAVLVDFADHRLGYDRAGPKGKTVTDPSAPEVLLLSPEGKLLALDGARDATDKTRGERVKAFRKRVLEVKNKKSGGGSAGPKNPFGG